MNLLEVFIILGSVAGCVLFSGGILWMIFINWTTGFTALGIGSVIIVITMLVALIYYVWEVYNHD
jgi:hypothetical protein